MNRISGIIKLIATLLVTTILGIPATVINAIDRPGWSHSLLLRFWAQIVLLIGRIRIRVIGRENLFIRRPAVIIINHESAFDIIVAYAGLPLQLRFMAKRELFWTPIVGWILYLGGHIPIDRQNRTRAIAAIEKTARRIIRRGYNIVVSPEGTRSPDGQIGPFKKGAFRLAEQFRLPIIPVTIIGTGQIVPKKKLSIRSGQVTLVVDRPVSMADYESLEACMADLRQKMIGNKERYGIQADNV